MGQTSAPQTMTLTNTNQTAIQFSAGNPKVRNSPSGFSISSSTCGVSLAAGASCTVAITFSPSLVGPESNYFGGNLTNPSSNTAYNNTYVYPLQGTGAGTPVALQVTPVLNFDTALSSQSITFGATPTVTVGGTGTVSASASSGLPVTVASSTPNICALSGNTVSGVAVGICTLTANQAGNGTYSPAPQAMLSFSIAANSTTPGAPTITAINSGAGSASIVFLPPANTGGSPITSYTATCTASGQPTRTATGSGSPITVRNLTGGVAYQCSLTATNGSGSTGTASTTMPVTPGPAKKNGISSIMLLLLD
jgi:hypothetical protein